MAIYFVEHALEKGECPGTGSQLNMDPKRPEVSYEELWQPSKKLNPGPALAHHGSTGSMDHSVVISLPPSVQWEKIHFVQYLTKFPYWFLHLWKKIRHSGKAKWNQASHSPTSSKNNNSRTKSHLSHLSRLKDADIVDPSYLYFTE